MHLLLTDARSPQLHSLANQEVLRWQLNMQKEIGNNVSHDDIKEFLWRTLKSGQVVPGWVPNVNSASCNAQRD